MNGKAKKIALYGVMAAAALILSYVESLIPAFFAVPGMKLGLTNIVVLVMLYLISARSALLVNIVRIILVSILFGNIASFAYSIAGGLLSFLVMYLLKKSGRVSIVAVSIAGGAAHNAGQILTAMFLLHTVSLAWYLIILWFAGITAGAVIGIIGAVLTRKLSKVKLFN